LTSEEKFPQSREKIYALNQIQKTFYSAIYRVSEAKNYRKNFNVAQIRDIETKNTQWAAKSLVKYKAPPTGKPFDHK
jgi:hypothetical protein